jgi:hypothetical protein
VLISQGLASCRINLLFTLRHVCFVCNKYLPHIGQCVLFYLAQPILDIIERVFLGHIVDKQNAHCSLIVCLGDGPKPFLPGSIPYLQLHVLVLDFDGFYSKVNPNGGHVACWKLVIRKSKQNASLTNT